jgi:predicted Zn-dependent protease with MMP-like domain
MNRRTFKSLVTAAINALPDDVVAQLDNVAFCVEDDSESGELLGEYIGVPRSERWGDDSGQLPDKIVLYRQAVVDECGGDHDAIAEEIRRTLWHEIAHHLGWDDDVLEAKEAEKGWR